MIIIVDYGIGNQGSILNRLKRMSVEAAVSSKPEDIEEAEKLILPGVGYFATGMENLRSYNLLPVLHQRVIVDKVPILGICLGMQLFTQRSEEGNANGLGWIDAETIKFDVSEEHNKLPVPHMGWNSIKVMTNSPIIANLPEGATYYFTHSYYVRCSDNVNIVATTHYGHDFTSIVQRDNIFGTQFHPEKSHQQGIALLQNFIRNA
ncbi:MAG: imidazole glycerol phosphate synthase subunit HisH [SAR202 cluster bacterium]|jgi:glutamine amidotransferase|nr:imidazole glycerol phosphate synthase subunit HisH [SAR202 cluster bacterium]